MKKELEYLRTVNERMTARNREAVIQKIYKCLNVLAQDESVSQYVEYDHDARRLSPYDTNNGVMGRAIELIDPICFYIDEQTGEREQCLYFHWLQCISYDVEKETYERILKYVSMWANDIFSKLYDSELETELLYDDATCVGNKWI